MNIRNIFTKLSIAIALVAIASTVTIWQVRRVRAAQPPDPDRTVGMVGITRGQTLRTLTAMFLVTPGPDHSAR